MAYQAYFLDGDGNGDWYQARAATSPGQSPATHPALWHKEELPYAFRDILVARSVAILLAGEGQDDKAAAKERISESKLEALRTRVAPSSDYRRRPTVLTR